jgi:hypothetical protein
MLYVSPTTAIATIFISSIIGLLLIRVHYNRSLLSHPRHLAVVMSSVLSTGIILSILSTATIGVHAYILTALAMLTVFVPTHLLTVAHMLNKDIRAAYRFSTYLEGVLYISIACSASAIANVWWSGSNYIQPTVVGGAIVMISIVLIIYNVRIANYLSKRK